MQKGILHYVFLFLVLMVIQVMVLNNIKISGYAYPQIYVLFILILPLGVSPWLLLTSSFLLGMSMDMFSDSLAIHTAACVFMAFSRPGVIRMLTGKIHFEETDVPGFRAFGSFTLFMYVVILVLLHHLVLFFLEIFRFTEVLQTLSRMLLSGSLSVIFVMIGMALLDKPQSRDH